jgi:hypothetical protein
MRVQYCPAKLLIGTALLGSLSIIAALQNASTPQTSFTEAALEIATAKEWERNKL